jgi:hypothetical protein
VVKLRRYEKPIAADQRIAGLGTPRLTANDQDATTDAAVPITDAPWLVTQRGTGARHRARQHPHAVLQQRAVRRVVDIRFYDRGVDAKSAAVRDPGTPCDVDDLSMQLLDDVRAERSRDLQDRLRVGPLAGIDARERAIDQVGADFLLQVGVTPVEQMLQDQHPEDDLRRRAQTAAAPTLRPAGLERLRDDLNHGLVLEQGVDLARPVRPQLVPIWQQNFEQTPLALLALNHARSFVESSRAGSLVREIDRRNRRIRTLGHGRLPAVDTRQ